MCRISVISHSSGPTNTLLGLLDNEFGDFILLRNVGKMLAVDMRYSPVEM
jgi:hypothetical protein